MHTQKRIYWLTHDIIIVSNPTRIALDSILFDPNLFPAVHSMAQLLAQGKITITAMSVGCWATKPITTTPTIFFPPAMANHLPCMNCLLLWKWPIRSLTLSIPAMSYYVRMASSNTNTTSIMPRLSRNVSVWALVNPKKWTLSSASGPTSFVITTTSACTMNSKSWLLKMQTKTTGKCDFYIRGSRVLTKPLVMVSSACSDSTLMVLKSVIARRSLLISKSWLCRIMRMVICTVLKSSGHTCTIAKTRRESLRLVIVWAACCPNTSLWRTLEMPRHPKRNPRNRTKCPIMV